MPYNLHDKKEEFGNKKEVTALEVSFHWYRYEEDAKLYSLEKDLGGGVTEVIIFDPTLVVEGEDRAIDRYRKYLNKNGEQVFEQWNSWIRPRNVVARKVRCHSGVTKSWSYYATGSISYFSSTKESNDAVYRHVSFDKHGHICYRETKKTRESFGFVGDKWAPCWGTQLLSEGCLKEMEKEEEPRSEGMSNNEFDSLPKYKIRNIVRGVTQGEGWMVAGRKVGEWTDKPPRCRKLRPCFYVRGVPVPEKVLKKPETITVDEILNELNAEVKRTMLEQLGYDVFLSRCGERLTVVDTNKDPHIGTLYHIADPTLQGQMRGWRDELLTDEEGEPRFNPDRVVALLKVKDGTLPKHYVLRVDPSCKTAKAANAWTWGLKPAQYHPLIER